MSQTIPDSAVLARIKKLLCMTTERGCSEAEAQVAASKAAALMEEYGLEMLTVERAGGEGEGREKAESRSAFGAWYADLMHAVAESCFCYCEVYQTGTGSKRTLRFHLIGRTSAVKSAEVLYEYLRTTIWRLARQSQVENQRLFRHGCAARVTQRVRERHRDKLVEQQKEAEQRQREQAARASHPGAAPQSTALVVTLVDHAQREADLNEDFRRGVAPGTTQKEREQDEAEAAAKTARMRDLTAKHGFDVAWWVVYRGRSIEEAIQIEQNKEEQEIEKEASETTEQRERREERERRQRAKDQEKQWREFQKQQRKQNHPSFQAGVKAAEHVGLDQQIRSGAEPASRNAKRVS